MESFPIHPDHMSIQEIATWGEQHKDHWVRRLAQCAGAFTDHVPVEYRDDPDGYFDHIDTVIHDLERSAEYAQEEECAHHQIEEWKEKYDALRLEFNLKEEIHTITHLKARITELHDEIEQKEVCRRRDAEFHASVVKELAQMKKKYDELHEKYHTFSVLAN